MWIHKFPSEQEADLGGLEVISVGGDDVFYGQVSLPSSPTMPVVVLRERRGAVPTARSVLSATCLNMGETGKK
jgi:hypothetical protein